MNEDALLNLILAYNPDRNPWDPAIPHLWVNQIGRPSWAASHDRTDVGRRQGQTPRRRIPLEPLRRDTRRF